MNFNTTFLAVYLAVVAAAITIAAVAYTIHLAMVL